MGDIPILRPVHRWVCPACKGTDVTHEARPHSRMHTCPALAMLSVPMDLVMVPEGTKAKVVLREPDDYIGNGDEDRTYTPDGHRPVMSIEIWRDEGQDAAVFVPTATVRLS